MNCTLISGPAGSGKTQRCLQAAAGWMGEHPGEPGVVFIVPTAAYAEEVKRRLARLQGGAAFSVRCLRFREAALEILRRHGMAAPELSEVAAALEADALLASDSFPLLSAVAGLPGVGESLAAFFSETKRYQVTAEDLARLAARLGLPRVEELSGAYQAYNERTAHLRDPAEAPAQAAALVASGGGVAFPLPPSHC